MESLLRGDSLSEEMRDFLYDAVKARATILVSGGTGSGKTTMINALSEAIPDGERVITIEDAYELTLSNRHVVSLQAKFKSSGDDPIIITQEDLMVASLRMRPDRIIVGEIREPSAAAVMLTAANTGHDGTMTTLHASSADVALNNRLSSLLMRSSQGGYTYDVARTEIALAIDLVVHIDRRAGHRFISEIALVDSTYLTSKSLRPLTLFEGVVTVSQGPGQEVVVRPSFRNTGKIPLATKLGVKLSDLGESASRWLSTTT
jgi:pilus assembly protein CpaF